MRLQSKLAKNLWLFPLFPINASTQDYDSCLAMLGQPEFAMQTVKTEEQTIRTLGDLSKQ